MLKGRYQLLKGYQNNHVTIGFGSYGQVKLAKDRDTGNIVAVKIINKLAKNQIVFHDKLSHSKIIQLLDYQIDRQRQITYMVLQYADDGTLFQKIKTNPLTKKQVKQYFKDVCEAILYLHSKEIMHRDIKPENILLTKKGQAKLCDFGFAAILGQRKTLCGTYQYMSPEMIQNKPYDYKIDVWALGILLFQMISGQAPFRGESPDQVLNEMKTKIYFCQRFESEQINLIKMILRVTPYKRPTIEQILSHKFFNQPSFDQQQEQHQQIINKMKKLTNISSNSHLQKQNSNSNSNTMNSNNSGKFFMNQHYMKKSQKAQNTKQPQNSYPFYMPRNKYGNNGSTNSNQSNNNNNNVSISNNKIIMPETSHYNINNNKVENKRIDCISPNKIIQTIRVNNNNQLNNNNNNIMSNNNMKVLKNVQAKQINNSMHFKNMNNSNHPHNNHHYINNNYNYSNMPSSQTSTTFTSNQSQSSKTLNYSMGYNYKSKFNSMHGQQINHINNNQFLLNQQKQIKQKQQNQYKFTSPKTKQHKTFAQQSITAKMNHNNRLS